MKKIILLLLFLAINFQLFSQNTKKNNCSEKLQVTFLSRETAKWELKNHTTARDYLNIVVDEKGIFYKNETLRDGSHLERLIKKDNTLFNEFNAVIGIYNEAKFEIFTDLLCWLNNFESYQVSEVQIYHFDNS
ncbi:MULTISPECIES: hypothetical protein [Aquimarina]|uniref:hypothetical protein n=1 Tax=Aquimarina TaxID=290174 RepID=UPI00094243D7|nr:MULTISPECIES: hypothetical protein [Aquimarina]